MLAQSLPLQDYYDIFIGGQDEEEDSLPMVPLEGGKSENWRGEPRDPETGKWVSTFPGRGVGRGLDPGGTISMDEVLPHLDVRDFEGQYGNRDHITRTAEGTVPTSAVRYMSGVMGEVPGEHRNKTGAEWEAFLDDIRRNGIRDPIFITVDPGKGALISEGSHRRDAAVELGLPTVPVEIRYFGHAELDYEVKASDNWRHQLRDPHTGKWIRMGAEMPSFHSDLSPPTLPGHEDLTLLHQPWSPPPKPKGTFVGRGGAGGFTSDGAATSLTESGRIGEAAFQRLTGGTLMHPPGKGEMSPLDVEWDGYAFEVKAVWTDSSRFAAWPKPHEIESKLAEAERLGKKAALSLVVMDRETNLAKIYYRDGLHGGRLSESKGWKFMGEVQLTISELESAAHMAANPNG